MSGKQKNQIVVLEPLTKAMQQLIASVEAKDIADVIRLKSADDVVGTVNASLPCLFIQCLIGNSETAQSVQLLKRLENVIKNGSVKVYISTPMKNRHAADIFTQKLGVTDFIIEPVPLRTMQFKINLALKALENFRRQQEIKKSSQKETVFKAKGDEKEDAAKGATVEAAKGKPALQMAEDTFLFKNGAVKKSGKKFLLEVEGPDPASGEWKPQEEDKGDAQSSWRWVPKDEEEQKKAGEAGSADGWVHKGDKPLFKEDTKKWALASEAPSLGFRKAGVLLAEKISTDENGEVTVAADSPGAAANIAKSRTKALEKARKQAEAAAAARLARKPEAEKNSAPGDTPKSPGQEKEELEKAAREKKSEEGTATVADASAPDEKSAGNDGQPLAKRNGKEKSSVEQVLAAARAAKQTAAAGKSIKDLRAGENEGETAGDGESAGTLSQANSEVGNAREASDSAPADAKETASAALAESKNIIGAGPSAAGVNAPEPSEPAAFTGVMDRRKKKNEDGKLASLKDRLGGLDSEESATADLAEEKPPLESAPEVAGKPEAAPVASEAPERKAKISAPAPEAPVALERAAPAEAEAPAPKTEDKRDHAPAEPSAKPEADKPAKLGPREKLVAKRRALEEKRRQEELSRLNDLLKQDEETGSAEGAALERIGGPEAKEGRIGDLSADKLQGIRGAFDGGAPELFSDDDEKKKKLLRDPKEAGEKLVREDNSFFVAEAKIHPPGNAWESAGLHFVYLSSVVHYKGFASLEEVLPLWIYEGDQVPELLHKSREWRFRGGKLTEAKSKEDLPKDVREFLLELRDRILRNKGEAAEPEPVAEEAEQASLEKEKSAPQAVSAVNARKRKGDPEGADQDFDESAPLKRAGKKSAGRSLDDLRDKLGSAEVQADAADFSEKSEPEDRKADDTAGAEAEITGLSRKKKSPAPPAEDEAPMAGLSPEKQQRIQRKKEAHAKLKNALGLEDFSAEAVEAAAPEAKSDSPLAPAEERVKRKKEKAKKLAALRDQLGLGAEEAQAEAEGESVSAEASEEAATAQAADEFVPERKKNKQAAGEGRSLAELREQLDERARPSLSLVEDEAPESMEEIGVPARGKLSGQEREAEAPRSANARGAEAFPGAPGAAKVPAQVAQLKLGNAPESVEPLPARPLAGPRSLLSVYVVLADCLGQEEQSEENVSRVLKSMENAFTQCDANCTGVPDAGNEAEVLYGSERASTAPRPRRQLSQGVAEPVKGNEDKEVVCYLSVQPKEERLGFNPSETTVIKRVATQLGPIVAKLETKAK